MIYKIMTLSNTSNNIDYWNFVKVDNASVTDFTIEKCEKPTPLGVGWIA